MLPLNDDELPCQLFFANASPQQLGRARLDDDAPLEVGAGAEAEVLVRRARVAVGAAVEAAAVRVDAEAEAEVGAVVLREDALRVVLVDLEPRRSGGSPRYST